MAKIYKTTAERLLSNLKFIEGYVHPSVAISVECKDLIVQIANRYGREKNCHTSLCYVPDFFLFFIYEILSLVVKYDIEDGNHLKQIHEQTRAGVNIIYESDFLERLEHIESYLDRSGKRVSVGSFREFAVDAVIAHEKDMLEIILRKLEEI